MHPASVLLIANRTCPCPGMLEEVARQASGGEVLVVAPALNSRLRHYVSDVDAATAAAGERLDEAVAILQGLAVPARGQVGDSDPLVAMEDALHAFPATTIVISTYPEGHSNWLERDLPRRAEERFGRPSSTSSPRFGLAAA
jgi:hypothetical protein